MLKDECQIWEMVRDQHAVKERKRAEAEKEKVEAEKKRREQERVDEMERMLAHGWYQHVRTGKQKESLRMIIRFPFRNSPQNLLGTMVNNLI